MLLIRCLALDRGRTPPVRWYRPDRTAIVDAVGRADARLHGRRRPAWPRPGRRPVPSGCGRARSARAIPWCSRKAAASTRCTGPPVPRRGRFAQEEVVAALDAATGKTIWEHKLRVADRGRQLHRRRRTARHAADRRQPALRRRVRGASSSRSTRTRARCCGRTISSRSTARPTSIAAWRTARCSSTTPSSSRSAAAGRRLARSIPRPVPCCGRPATSNTRPRRRS